MNFTIVTQTKGLRTPENYPQRIAMFATLTQIGGAQTNDKGTVYSKCKLTDDQGVSHNVTLYGTPPPMNLLNTRQTFSLSAFDGNYQGKPYIGYSGFWQNGNKQQPQQQAPHQPAPPRQAPSNKDAERQSIERQCSWKGVCRIAAARSDMTAADAVFWAKTGLYFIETGDDLTKVPTFPQNEGEDGPPPPQDSDPPF